MKKSCKEKWVAVRHTCALSSDLLQAFRKLSGTRVLLDRPIKKVENINVEKAAFSSD